MNERDDYLWDPSGTPDPEIQRLEDLLSGHRYVGEAPARPRRRGFVPWIAAAAAVLVVGLGLALMNRDPAGPAAAAGWAYRLTSAGGDVSEQGTLRVGQWLETDRDTIAEVEVADIGRVTLDPVTRLQLLATGQDQHRIHLARGRMTAVVDAPPELFIAETPAATAVDMGCAYELVVDENGDGFLRVTSGLVELRRTKRRSVVPAGALCEARDKGLGTPRFETASSPLRIALRELDFGDGGRDALGTILDSATERDTLTLWHLLQHPRVSRPERARVLDVLESFTEMPTEATRDGTLALDPPMLDAWYRDLERFW